MDALFIRYSTAVTRSESTPSLKVELPVALAVRRDSDLEVAILYDPRFFQLEGIPINVGTSPGHCYCSCQIEVVHVLVPIRPTGPACPWLPVPGPTGTIPARPTFG